MGATRVGKMDLRVAGRLVPILTVMVLLLTTAPVSSDDDDPRAVLPWYDAQVTEVGSWRDPSGDGSDLAVHPSPGGDRLLVWGYGGPADVRVMDRVGGTLQVLELPIDDATLKGILWSWEDRWLAAWGRAPGADADFLAMWDADTYAPSEDVFENGTTPLPVVDAVYFMAAGYIVGLGGRDVNGTSRVLILETVDLSLRADHEWKDNVTLLFMTTDGRDLVCVDETGGVTVISGLDWQGSQRFQGFEMMPTATSNQFTRSNEPWLLGFENGSYQVWRCCPWELSETHDMGEGPIQALTNIWDLRAWFSMVATPHGDGSELLVSRTYYQWGIVEYIADPYHLDTPVTMITQDPSVPGHLWVGFTDGSLALLNVTFTEDEAPEAYILEPENNKDHFGDTVHFSGNYSDDHDRIVWIRVQVDEGEWQEVDWADGEWSWELDISGMKQETNHRVTVLAFDGRKESTGDGVLINIFEPREDERGMEFGFWFFFSISVIALLILVSTWFYVRRKATAQEELTKGSGQD